MKIFALKWQFWKRITSVLFNIKFVVCIWFKLPDSSTAIFALKLEPAHFSQYSIYVLCSRSTAHICGIHCVSESLSWPKNIFDESAGCSSQTKAPNKPYHQNEFGISLIQNQSFNIFDMAVMHPEIWESSWLFGNICLHWRCTNSPGRSQLFIWNVKSGYRTGLGRLAKRMIANSCLF